MSGVEIFNGVEEVESAAAAALGERNIDLNTVLTGVCLIPGTGVLWSDIGLARAEVEAGGVGRWSDVREKIY